MLLRGLMALPPPRRPFPANVGGMKVMKILISQPRIILNRNLKFLTPRFVKFYENSDLNGLLECAKVACYYGKLFEYTLYSFLFGDYSTLDVNDRKTKDSREIKLLSG